MQYPHYRVLRPSEAGDINGDFFYEFDGERSSTSYASRRGAQNALNRRLERWLQDRG